MRFLVALLMFGFVSSNGGGDSASPPPGAVPELVVSLAPAEGVIPLDAADQVSPYRFFVIALDKESRTQYGSSDVLVRLGQKRELKGGRLRGSVNLHEDGSAYYRAELVVDGKILARTSASVKVKTPR